MPHLFLYIGGNMNKGIITISLPNGSSQDDILAIRNKYKDKYKVNIIISGTKNPSAIIKNFLKAGLEV